ncbi:MAG: uncharacterized protein KVP18_001453 [Porospora cf. gigantea A]|uniref:uncharacterized protein n=1 Tax=Porospora cf. gigantea A TaxID=2853593 RepID=UPI00355A8288|nr:MAG: hypothetical protein KVP18_001453 [Porospora cf. gigantea A]
MRPLAASLDIGGTLAKIALLTRVEQSSPLGAHGEKDLSFRIETATDRFEVHFGWWYTVDVQELVYFLKDLGVTSVAVAGGGAHRFDEQLKSAFSVVKVDEMEAAARGLAFLFDFSMVNREPFFASVDPAGEVRWEASSSPVFPFILVTVGSGVSIIKILSPVDYERVSGTCIGGGTALGLAHCLLGVDSFDGLIELAEKGSGVLDLTAGESSSVIFPPDTLACSFGRIFEMTDVDPASVAWSVLHMVANNLGYLTHLVAQVHGCSKIYFGGKFVHQHPPTMASVTKGVSFAEKHYCNTDKPDPIEAFFIKHDGYLGAIGALIHISPVSLAQAFL